MWLVFATWILLVGAAWMGCPSCLPCFGGYACQLWCPVMPSTYSFTVAGVINGTTGILPCTHCDLVNGTWEIDGGIDEICCAQGSEVGNVCPEAFGLNTADWRLIYFYCDPTLGGDGHYYLMLMLSDFHLPTGGIGGKPCAATGSLSGGGFIPSDMCPTEGNGFCGFCAIAAWSKQVDGWDCQSSQTLDLVWTARTVGYCDNYPASITLNSP